MPWGFNQGCIREGEETTVLIGLSHPPGADAYFWPGSGVAPQSPAVCDGLYAGSAVKSARKWVVVLNGCDKPISTETTFDFWGEGVSGVLREGPTGCRCRPGLFLCGWACWRPNTYKYQDNLRKTGCNPSQLVCRAWPKLTR